MSAEQKKRLLAAIEKEDWREASKALNELATADPYLEAAGEWLVREGFPDSSLVKPLANLLRANDAAAYRRAAEKCTGGLVRYDRDAILKLAEEAECKPR